MKAVWVALAAVVVAAWVTAPHPTVRLGGALPDGHVRGVVHIHTTRSDGGGSLLDVAAAAARAGLRFVVVTDHGDGLRPERQPPTYMGGVLVIDAVEVTTRDGHVLGLGLGPIPYRLGGKGVDVVDDINRFGGFAVAAHGDSPKRSLRWRAWDAALTGLEWINGDSEWRDEPRMSLLAGLLHYPVRPVESLTRILDRPAVTLARWDELQTGRRLITLAGADAHARMGGSAEDDPRWWRRLALPIPGYAPLFSAFSVTATGVTLTGQADADAQAVLSALRSGHSYTTVDGAVADGWVRFSARSATRVAEAGDLMPVSAGAVTITGEVPAGPDWQLTLMKNGQVLSSARGPRLVAEVDGAPAAYRLEVTAAGLPGGPPVPWAVSNAIIIGRETGWGSPAAPRDWPDAPDPSTIQAIPPTAWAAEHSVSSLAASDVVAPSTAMFRFGLGGAESSGPFAAVAAPVEGLSGAVALRLALRAAAEMRVSVELRGTGPGGGTRWRRSIYVGTATRAMSIPLSAFEPVGDGPDSVDSSAIRSVMLVVDGVNTPSGRSGSIWIERAEILGAARPASGPDRQQQVRRR